MGKMFNRAIMALVGVLFLSLPSILQAQTLRIGLAAAVTSLDPHYYNATPNHTVALHVFETLTNRGPLGRVLPSLAESWSVKNDKIWEFKLRPYVKWHDGRDFTADDVLFSLKRVRNVPGAIGGFSGILTGIVSVEALDPLTVRIITDVPVPNMPVNLTAVEIVSRHAGEGSRTEDYNSGKAMIGTGPYKFVRYLPGDRVELSRNDSWWGPKQEWEGVSLRIVSNVATRMAALLAGELDIAELPSAPDVARLKKDKRFAIYAGPSLRVSYILPFYQAGKDADPVRRKDGSAYEKSPLLDPKVRKALSIAINRTGLADRVMYGLAIPTGQFMPEGSYTYALDIPVPTYDPDEAKRLLTEAGYGDGFRLSMSVANDRVPYNVEVAQAIAQMWARLGIVMNIDAMPTSVAVPKAVAQKIPIYIDNFGNSTAEVSRMILALLHTVDQEKSKGEYNWMRYSNPTLDAAIDRAVEIMDDRERDVALQEATKIAVADNALIPLFHFVNVWATRAGISYTPRGDALTLATSVQKVSP